MNSKSGQVVIATLIAMVCWYIGGFILGKGIGMIFVMFGITIVGLAVGNLMDSPEPSQDKR
jgi:hypothetical protein